MRERKTKARKAKAPKKAVVRRRALKTKPAKKTKPLIVPVVPTPAAKPKRHAVHNGLVLVAAVVTLAILAGVAAVPRLFGPSDRTPAGPDQAAFTRAIDRAVAEGPPPVVDIAPFIAPVVVQAPETEPDVYRRMAGRADAIDVQRGATVPRRTPRSRHSAAISADALTAMAKASSNDLIVEARKYLGGNPTGWAADWCGKFLDMVLKKTGRRGGGNLARGYIKYGTRLAGPEVGAIAIFSRKGGGHVGIVTGIDSNGNPIIISGNHNDRVAVAIYPASRALAYVRP